MLKIIRQSEFNFRPQIFFSCVWFNFRALKTASALHQLQNLRSVLLDKRQVFLVLAALTFLLNQRSNWTATPFLIEIPPTLHTRNNRRSRHIRPRLQAGTKSDQTWRLPFMIRRDTAQITISFPTPQITPLESKLESLVRTVSGWKMRTEREEKGWVDVEVFGCGAVLGLV